MPQWSLQKGSIIPLSVQYKLSETNTKSIKVSVVSVILVGEKYKLVQVKSIHDVLNVFALSLIEHIFVKITKYNDIFTAQNSLFNRQFHKVPVLKPWMNVKCSNQKSLFVKNNFSPDSLNTWYKKFRSLNEGNSSFEIRSHPTPSSISIETDRHLKIWDSNISILNRRIEPGFAHSYYIICT